MYLSACMRPLGGHPSGVYRSGGEAYAGRAPTNILFSIRISAICTVDSPLFRRLSMLHFLGWGGYAEGEEA